ncbi:MAG: hypothetical protein JNL70_26605 [Saprospiraceae bacterium]|nr:hypothetical protein [Saprospiraceae bacterium]
MKSKFFLILFFASMQTINAQQTPSPTQGQQKTTGEQAKEIIEIGSRIKDLFKSKQLPKTPESTSQPQTIASKGVPAETNQAPSPAEQKTSSIPRLPQTVPTPDDKSGQSPVVTTSVTEIDEMPDLGLKVHDGIKYSVKQWQQIGAKVVVKMVVENKDANAPMKSLRINGQQNTIYDSGGNKYNGTITQIANFVSKDNEVIEVPLVFGAKAAVVAEFNVGIAKISKVVGINFRYQHGSWETFFHFITMTQ